MRPIKAALVVSTLAASLAAPAVAVTTITLQQGLNGYSGVSDSWLDESATSRNYGGANTLRIQWYNGRNDCVVLKFDLTGKIPPAARIVSATLSLYYYQAGSFQDDNAMQITPYRLAAGAWWNENIYDGQAGTGVSYNYRDVNELYTWTGGAEGGWYDKIDDGNGRKKIKRADGTPQDAIPPQNWVPFDVTPTVTQWNAGATNNGFLLVATGFEGGGTTVYGLFFSRNESGWWASPQLSITYEEPVGVQPSSWSLIKALYR